MKTIGKIRRSRLFSLLFLGWVGVSHAVFAQAAPSESDFISLPPFLSPDAKPNVLLVVDNSGSMDNCAYPTNPTNGKCTGDPEKDTIAFDNTKLYRGYFDEGHCYDYRGGKFHSGEPKAAVGPACSEPKPWDGNFLNWLTMKRLDIVKWTLTGGQCSAPRPNENDCTTLRVGSSLSSFQKTASFSGVGPATFASGTRCAKVAGALLTIYATSTCSGSVASGAIVGRFSLLVDRGAPQTGVIQKIGERARFGLMQFNEPLPSTENEGGKVVAKIGGDRTALVNTLEALTPTTFTPLAESLYEAIRYYAQVPPAYSSADYSVAIDNDPYYQVTGTDTTGAEIKGWVGCCKSYILLLTDGFPTQDQNIPSTLQDIAHGAIDHGGTPTDHHATWVTSTGGTHYLDDVAYWGHITDLRPASGNIAVIDKPPTTNATSAGEAGGRLPGLQNITLYTMIAFENPDPTKPNLLKDAARTGGFDDENGNNLPDLVSEWDKLNNVTRALVPDGVPDNYFAANDADTMRTGLLTVIGDILQKSAAATAVSFISTSTTGEGGIYQSYFLPTATDVFGRTVSWVGYLQALFIDDRGQFREDSNADGRLTYTEDRIVETFYNAEERRAEGLRCESDANGDKIENSCIEIGDLTNIKPLWEGGQALAKRAASDRNIWTWMDGTNNNNTVESGEVIPFSKDNKTILKAYLRAKNEDESSDIIQFIRGERVTGYRERERNIAGVDLTWKLGDILNSDPVVVGSPMEGLDKKYGDVSYTKFSVQYKTRRQVIYAGGNDGMLHAFNGGFYHAGDDPGTPDKREHGFFTTNKNDNDGGRPLGEELWAFVPQELLPHLKFLTSADYTAKKHFYFVDGASRVVDAQIFPDDADHPNGWGTVLIASMRMGGGLFPVDLDGDGNTTDPGEDRFRSAYFAFDITNPETPTAPPKLLWVFKDSDLGFATGFPAIVRLDTAWYVVFGSGPLSYKGERKNGSSENRFGSSANEYGQIYAIDLKTGALKAKKQLDNTDRYAFMGDPSAFDLERDVSPSTGERRLVSDVIYIGKAYGSAGTGWKGKMHRILTNGSTDPADWTYSVLLDPGKPVLVRPTVTQDAKKRPWIFFGTGRLFSSGPGSDQHDLTTGGLYGIKEGGPNGCWDPGLPTSPIFTPMWEAECAQQISLSNLYDATTVSVQKGGCYQDCSDPAERKTIFDLANEVINDPDAPQGGKDGWFITLGPGERVLAKATLFGGTVVVPTYTPYVSDDVCATVGTSALHAAYYETGTAFANHNNPLGVFSELGDNDTILRNNASIKIDASMADTGTDADRANKGLGVGKASEFHLIAQKKAGGGDVTVTGFTQTSTGNLVTLPLKVGPRPEGVKLFMEKVE